MKFLNKLLHLKKGQAPIIGLVVAVISIVVVTLVGALIVGNLEVVSNDMTTAGMLSADGNSTVESVIDSTWTSFNLMTVLPIILFASAVIGALGAYMAWR